MRLVFISAMNTAPWGGSEELWSRAAMRLAEKGHQVGASVAYWPKSSPKIGALEKGGVDLFVRKPAPTPPLPVRIAQKIARRMGVKPRDAEWEWIRQRNPELVVVSQGQNADGCLWMERCLGLNLPFTAIIQCNSESMWPDDCLAEKLTRLYLAARRVFCVSRHNLDLLERQLGESLPGGRVVWNPVNIPAGPPCAWPPDDGVWRLACVARLEPANKGQDVLFEALAHPRWRERPVEINLYGGGEREAGLQKLARRLGLTNVHFCGHTSDIRAVWERHHLLLLSSRSEGLPLALVEAMLCGRPALVTDIGGNTEACVDGQTGFVVPAPAASLLEEGLERAWQRRADWKMMGEAARRHIDTIFPTDPIEEFCRQLLESDANRLHHE